MSLFCYITCSENENIPQSVALSVGAQLALPVWTVEAEDGEEEKKTKKMLRKNTNTLQEKEEEKEKKVKQIPVDKRSNTRR